MQPQSHRSAEQSALDVLSTIRQDPGITETALTDALVAKGYSRLDATKLCLFVPSAFAWAMLKAMGMQSFPATYNRINADGSEYEVAIATEHHFMAALRLAYAVLQQGWTEQLSRPLFELVIARSAEMGAVNRLLDAGHQITDATLEPPRFCLPQPNEV
jgi:hypothetical protein